MQPALPSAGAGARAWWEDQGGDAVKKEALRRAGIGYVEVIGGEMNLGELRRVVERLVASSAGERLREQPGASA